MNFIISNTMDVKISVEDLKNVESKRMSALNSIMQKYAKLIELPVLNKKKCFIHLKNSDAKLANAIRRVLMSHIPIYALDCTFDNIKTDDRFLPKDYITKQINLIPIDQNENYSMDKSIKLIAKNTSPNPIRITTNHIVSKRRIIKGNIPLFKLNPGKSIEIDLFISRGTSIQDAGKFTPFDNISYQPMGFQPYNQFTKTGARSLEQKISEFKISFTTRGNISIAYVIDTLRTVLLQKVNTLLEHVKAYQQSGKKQYSTTDFKVVFDEIYEYKLLHEHIALSHMVAHECLQIDRTTPFVSPSRDRYDERACVIRLNHAQPNKLLIDALNSLIKKIQKIKL